MIKLSQVLLCEAIKGLTIARAKKLMEDVIANRRMIPYRRYRKKRAHHAQTKGPGGSPVKVAKIMIKLLDSLEANAEFKGLGVDKIRILHVAAHRGRAIAKFIERAFGRSTPYNKTLVYIEIVGQPK